MTNQSQLSFTKGLSLSSLFCLILFCAIGTSSAHAVEYTVSCTDLSDASSCSISGDGSLNEDLNDVVLDLIDAIESGTDPDEVCSAGPETDSYICPLGETGSTELFCQEETEGSTTQYSCNINGLNEAFFAMNCSEDGDSGACTISSDETAIEAELAELDISPEFTSFATNLLSGCGALGGTEAFRSDCGTLLGALADGDLDEVSATLAAIAPTSADIATDISFYSIGTQLSHITNRLSRLRKGVSSGSTESTSSDVSALKFYDGRQWVSAGELLASSNETLNDASPSSAQAAPVPADFSRVGFFMDGSIIAGEQSATTAENEADMSTNVFTMGIDYLFSQNLVGGVAFSVAMSEVDYGNDKGELDDLGLMLFAYGSYFHNNWYVDASLGLGGDDYEQQRRLICDASCGTAFDQTAESDFSGRQISFLLGTGYTWSHGALTVNPYAQFASVSVDVDGYRETMSDPGGPGAGFALDIGDQSRDSVTLSIGTQVSYAMSMDWGVWVPYFDLKLFSESEDDDYLVQGSFVGNVGVDDSFDLVTNEIDTSYYTATLGSTFQFTEGNVAFFDFQTLLGHEDVDQSVITAGWRWEL